jgi:hypothetical protein
MCCGQKRSELRSNPEQTMSPAVPQYVSGNNQARRVQPQARVPISKANDVVNLRSLQNSLIRVRGPNTGRRYEFSGLRPVQPVDARDVSALLLTRLFRRA